MSNIFTGPINASAPTGANVGTTQSQALSANIARQGLIIINIGMGTVSIAIGQTAQLNLGITLAPLGVWNMDEYQFSTDAINVIGFAEGSISIQEFIR